MMDYECLNYDFGDFMMDYECLNYDLIDFMMDYECLNYDLIDFMMDYDGQLQKMLKNFQFEKKSWSIIVIPHNHGSDIF